MLSRLFCGCLAPVGPLPTGGEERTGGVKQAPAQPDSTPVKPRDSLAKGATIIVHTDLDGAPADASDTIGAVAALPQQKQQAQDGDEGQKPGEAQEHAQGDSGAMDGGGGSSSTAHAPLPCDEASVDVVGMLTTSGEPPQAPLVSSAAPAHEGSEASATSGTEAAAAEAAASAAAPTKRAPASPSKRGVRSQGAASKEQDEHETDVVKAMRNSRQGRKNGGAAGAADTSSPPGSPGHHLPARGTLRPPPPADLAAAMANLGTPHPVDPVADLNVVRAAAVHTPEALVSQLDVLVPLLLRTMRAPRLGTARAAICTFRDLFAVSGLGGAMLPAVSDDSSPTSSAVLALMQKATGGDLNSKRIAADANACLCTMVESVPAVACIEMLENYATSAKMHVRVRSKAGALIVAASYRLAVTSLPEFDKDVMVLLLKIAEPLLTAGSSCRQIAKKLAVVVHSAFCNQPHLHAPGSPRKGGRVSPAGAESGSPAKATGEEHTVAEAWAEFVRLQVEPETAAVLGEAVMLYGQAGQELVAAADLDGFSMGHPVAQVVARLVLASE